MARYRITKPHYLAGVYYNTGDVVEWDGQPSDAMIALDPPPAPVVPKKRRKSKAKKPARRSK